ncbi:MAG: hypothetical protein OCC45_08210 [Desulfotalea sp.]
MIRIGFPTVASVGGGQDSSTARFARDIKEVVMKIIRFDHWVIIEKNCQHQVVERHGLTICLFGFAWKDAVVWRKYINDFNRGWRCN